MLSSTHVAFSLAESMGYEVKEAIVGRDCGNYATTGVMGCVFLGFLLLLALIPRSVTFPPRFAFLARLTGYAML
jgi:hypothetical protein